MIISGQPPVDRPHPHPHLPPRGFRTRVVRAAALDAAVAVPLLALAPVLAELTAWPLAWLAEAALLSALLAWLAPKVSFDRRRAVLAALTVAGGLILFFVVAWRLAYLPYRDWPPADHEVAPAGYLREARYSGIWVLTDAADGAPASSPGSR